MQNQNTALRARADGLVSSAIGVEVSAGQAADAAEDVAAKRLLRGLLARQFPPSSVYKELRAHKRKKAWVDAAVAAHLASLHPAPVEEALRILAGYALAEPAKPAGYRLYDRPADLRQVVCAANDILTRWGQPKISYPGA